MCQDNTAVTVCGRPAPQRPGDEVYVCLDTSVRMLKHLVQSNVHPGNLKAMLQDQGFWVQLLRRIWLHDATIAEYERDPSFRPIAEAVHVEAEELLRWAQRVQPGLDGRCLLQRPGWIDALWAWDEAVVTDPSLLERLLEDGGWDCSDSGGVDSSGDTASVVQLDTKPEAFYRPPQGRAPSPLQGMLPQRTPPQPTLPQSTPPQSTPPQPTLPQPTLLQPTIPPRQENTEDSTASMDGWERSLVRAAQLEQAFPVDNKAFEDALKDTEAYRRDFRSWVWGWRK